MKCEICQKPESSWTEEREKLKQVDQFHVAHALCSIDCYVLWVKGRHLWLVIQLLKNMSTWTFERFQKVFEFNTAGGYAQDKFDKMRGSTFLFTVGLSKDNVLKLAKNI